jgi:hypothetical protein
VHAAVFQQFRREQLFPALLVQMRAEHAQITFFFYVSKKNLLGLKIKKTEEKGEKKNESTWNKCVRAVLQNV